MKTDHTNHYEATLGIHTGSFTFARPSFGSWVSYGLGTENRNLPSFVVIAPQSPYAGHQVWGSDFLPGAHQGTRVVPGPEPIANVRRRSRSERLQAMELAALQAGNNRHLAGRGVDPLLAARIKSFETAFGMQSEMPEAFDLAQESTETHALYGLERGSTKGFAWQCLVARRLAERGVRFIELIDAGADINKNWDAHFDLQTHRTLARNVDQPIAGLLKDLKSRGMLEDTLVVWTTEFGRTPFLEKADGKGREHHSRCFSSWLAGGGAKLPGVPMLGSDNERAPSKLARGEPADAIARTAALLPAALACSPDGVLSARPDRPISRTTRLSTIVRDSPSCRRRRDTSSPLVSGPSCPARRTAAPSGPPGREPNTDRRTRSYSISPTHADTVSRPQVDNRFNTTLARCVWAAPQDGRCRPYRQPPRATLRASRAMQLRSLSPSG
jgi:hypothetical protein